MKYCFVISLLKLKSMLIFGAICAEIFALVFASGEKDIGV